MLDTHGRHVVLTNDAGQILAEATPCHRMATALDGRRYRPWLVKVSTPGHKYGFVTVPSKARAIALIQDDNERIFYQGRPMGLWA